jgi:hypothetical protein
MLDGVRNSAGMDEKTGTRFGGFGNVLAAANTSRIVSSDGWTTICRMLSIIGAGGVSRSRQNILVAPCLFFLGVEAIQVSLHAKRTWLQ